MKRGSRAHAPRPPVEGPVRTCVITRESGSSESMVRVLVGPDGRVEVDYRARLGGRGAWLLPRRDVIAAAESRAGVLARALHVETCDTAGLLDRVRAANERVIGDLLSLAARAGSLASGGEMVHSIVRAKDTLGLLIASDASPQSVESAVGSAVDLSTWTMPWDREEIGRRIGKGPRAIVALRPASATRALVEELRRMQELR